MCVCPVPFKLQEGEVRIISLSQCQSYFDMKTITPRMLCAGYDAGTVDSCMVTSAVTCGRRIKDTNCCWKQRNLDR